MLEQDDAVSPEDALLLVYLIINNEPLVEQALTAYSQDEDFETLMGDLENVLIRWKDVSVLGSLCQDVTTAGLNGYFSPYQTYCTQFLALEGDPRIMDVYSLLLENNDVEDFRDSIELILQSCPAESLPDSVNVMKAAKLIRFFFGFLFWQPLIPPSRSLPPLFYFLFIFIFANRPRSDYTHLEQLEAEDDYSDDYYEEEDGGVVEEHQVAGEPLSLVNVLTHLKDTVEKIQILKKLQILQTTLLLTLIFWTGFDSSARTRPAVAPCWYKPSCAAGSLVHLRREPYRVSSLE